MQHVSMDHRVKPGGDERDCVAVWHCGSENCAKSAFVHHCRARPGNPCGGKARLEHSLLTKRHVSMDHRVKPGGDEGDCIAVWHCGSENRVL